MKSDANGNGRPRSPESDEQSSNTRRLITGNNMKVFLMTAATATFLVLTGASAASAAPAIDFSPAVTAGFQVHFGARQAKDNTASLRFAAGYAAPITASYSRVDDPAVRGAVAVQPQIPLIPLFDGNLSERPESTFLRVAGLRLTGSDRANADESSESGWWSRNWWWVTLSAVGAGVAAAASGGSHHSDDQAKSSTNCGVSGDVVGPNKPTVDTNCR